MTTASRATEKARQRHSAAPQRSHGETEDSGTARTDLDRSSPDSERSLAAMTPIRKAAIVLVSLEQSLASQLLAQLDRSSVEAVTWEIARLDRLDPAEQTAVLDEFLRL